MAIARVESQIGRKFRIDHRYYRWDAPIPTSYDAWTSQEGRIPFLNWNARRRNGTVVTWSRIASGAEDSWIEARADAFETFGKPLYLSFHHEPEDDVTAFGSAADYAAAFRHVVDVFRARGVTNVTFVWTMMSWTFTIAKAAPFYPGDAYVDAIGTDGYNWYPGKPNTRWRSFDWIMTPSRNFAIAHGKPLMVVEYGVQEDPAVPGRKGAWFREMLATVKAWPEVVALIYYDSPIIYPWMTDTSASSMGGYREIALDPYLNPA